MLLVVDVMKNTTHGFWTICICPSINFLFVLILIVMIGMQGSKYKVATWHGTKVAVKVLSSVDFSDESLYGPLPAIARQFS